MRRLKLLATFLLALCLLTGCTPHADLYGCWATSPTEALCSSVLWLDGDGEFTLIQEGVTVTGKWELRGGYVTLNTDDQRSISLVYKVGALSMDGLKLYRQASPEIAGYWLSPDDDVPGHISLHLFTNGYFTQGATHSDALDAVGLDSDDQLDGSWETQGRLLILRCKDGSICRYRLSPDGTAIDMGNGVLLKRVWTSD